MAPEQAAGQDDVDHRADLYAWGIVAWELFAGRHPFASKPTPQALLVAHFIEMPVPLAEQCPDVPAHVADIVMRCVAKDPAERPASAAEVLRALAAADALARAPSSARSASPAGSVAVLPFTNLSADQDDEYFSDGMTEEVINALARRPGVRVAARTSSFAFRASRRICAVSASISAWRRCSKGACVALVVASECQRSSRALTLDPLSATTVTARAFSQIIGGHPEAALSTIDEWLARWPLDAEAHRLPGLALEAADRPHEACIAFRRAGELDPTHRFVAGDLAATLAIMGETDEARRIVSEMERATIDTAPPAMMLALVHHGLGESMLAFTWLARALEAREFWVSMMHVDPMFRRMHGDARFEALVRRVGVARLR